jgi:acyl-CoA thioesterase-1
VHITNVAQNGAGYVAASDTGGVFLDLVNRVVDARSRVVLIFGSDNDIGQPDIAAAMSGTLERIKTLAPQAMLIVAGPLATPADPAPQLTGIRDALQASAQQVGGRFVDPLALKWFQGQDSNYIGPDGEHPNVAGEQYLADRMAEVLTPVLA